MKNHVMMKKSEGELKIPFKMFGKIFFYASNIVREEQKSFFVLFSFLNKNLKRGQFLEVKTVIKMKESNV